MAIKKNLVDKVYKLTREAAPLSFMLPTRNTSRFPLLWFDEKNRVNRALRYARNQKSIFEDEQDGNAIIEPIIFEDGFLRVPSTNPILQEFLHHHPLNGKKFVEVNDEKDASDVVEKINMEVDALVEAKNLTIEQVETIGRVVLGRDVTKTSVPELRRDILVFARREPETFLNIISDPLLKLQAKVRIFFENKLLSFRNNKKDVFFSTSSKKNKMMTVGFNEDPFTSIVSYFQTEDGVEDLKFLENLLEME